jgi:hypothetical protein
VKRNNKENVKTRKEYIVYQVVINKVVRYIGRTVSLENRIKQHISSCFTPTNKSYNKKFYQYIRLNNISKEEFESGFSIINKFKNKLKSKQYECYLILGNKFSDNTIIQNVPNISDGF